jgi:hypothetical protein
MSWKRHFDIVPVNQRLQQALKVQQNNQYSDGLSSSGGKYASYLAEYYAGHPQRIQRYQQYNEMDQDPIINSALDTIADFCTQIEERNDDLFQIIYRDETSDDEVQIIKTSLKQWTYINEFRRRIWRTIRNVIKYGDQFFIRDPETLKWIGVSADQVEKVVVNSAAGKKPEYYIVKDLDLNLQTLTASKPEEYGNNVMGSGSPHLRRTKNTTSFNSAQQQSSHAVDAVHVIHLSLSEGLDANWPFGTSVLESVFKVYRQKELIADAIIIYRIVRAPERRVFYVDVGNMPPHKAQAYLERMKNEIAQRRFPTRQGGSSNIVDAAYNPMCLDLNTRIPLLDGRTLSLNDLITEYQEGKENWVYSCNPETGAILPGNITWAGVTRTNTQVIKLTFDNGKTLICTPDHKIPVMGKGFVEAQKIQNSDSLISFETKSIQADSYIKKPYVYDHSISKWVPVNGMVGEFFRRNNKHQEFTFLPSNIGRNKNIIFNRDYDYNNNSPKNIVYINNEDCLAFDIYNRKNEYYNVTPYVYTTISEKISRELDNFQKLTEVEKCRYIENAKATYCGNNSYSIDRYCVSDTAIVTKVVCTEYIDQPMNVGTITVDGQERWHNFHTFAIESGIFVKNSMMEDFFFAQSCLSLNTKIPLLSGEEKTLSEIIDDHNNGIENFVYGLDDKTFELEPAKIVWAGVTRKNAEVIKITLDNNKEIIATPDHRFITRDGEETEAQHLTLGQSLMPLEIYNSTSGPNQKSKLYKKYICNSTGKSKFVHITISSKPAGKAYHTHHKDFNSFNNNPTNLEVMLAKDHIELHKNAGTYSLQTQWNNPEKRQKLLQGIHALYKNPSAEFLEKLSNRNRKNGSKTWENQQSAKKVIEDLKITQARICKRKQIRYSIDMYNRMNQLFEAGYTSISKLTKVLRNDEIFQNHYRENNKHILRDKNIGNQILPTDKTLNSLVRIVGFERFGEWKQTKLNSPTKYSSKVQNHKIIKIEWLKERIDTGDITIESKSNSHWFGLSAGIYVHNSEGRGSKVETLPGGESLGQIDDLRFWNNSLLRGLQVPSSYLPSGPEDGSAVYNDGRVGTAYMQEFRFARYCQRLQSLVVGVFDREFKLFLKQRGINIDSSLFELRFNPPMDFRQFAQIERDAAQIAVFQPLVEVKFLSRRFILKRFLGLSDDELIENERMWREENTKAISSKVRAGDSTMGSAPGLESIGLRSEEGPEMTDDFDSDFDIGGDTPEGGDMGSGLDETPPESTGTEGGL